MKQTKLASLLLRIGLAAVLLYAGVAALLNPQEWIGFLPGFVSHILPAALALTLFSLFQIALAVWLLSGFKTRYAAFLTALTVVGITVANLSALITTFRDVAIIFAALALAILSTS